MCALTLRKRPAARAWWARAPLMPALLAAGLDSTVRSVVLRRLAVSLHPAASDLRWLRSVRAVLPTAGLPPGGLRVLGPGSLAAAWIRPRLRIRAEAGIMLWVSGAPAAIGIVLGTCPAMAGDRGTGSRGPRGRRRTWRSAQREVERDHEVLA